jgi:hypothetical protein
MLRARPATVPGAKPIAPPNLARQEADAACPQCHNQHHAPSLEASATRSEAAHARSPL